MLPPFCEPNQYSNPKIKEVYVAKYVDDLDWISSGGTELILQSTIIDTFTSSLTWYEIPVEHTYVSFTQELEKGKQGIISNDVLSIGIPHNEEIKWNELTELLPEKYVVVFGDNNDNYWVFGYITGAKTDSYQFNSEMAGFTFTFTSKSDNKLITAISKDYVDNTIKEIPNTFISKWKTNNQGTSNDNQIALPLQSIGTYNFIVDWGDGNQDTITAYGQPETVHTYNFEGEYTISIIGVCKGWRFWNTIYNEPLKILNISAWGDLEIIDYRTFYDCNNLTITATDKLNVSGITDMDSMFGNCTSLTSIDVTNWDTSNVIDMSSIFNTCTSLTEIKGIETWNVSNVTTLHSTFINCNQLTHLDLSNWNISNNLNDLRTTFHSTYNLQYLNVTGWDTSNVTNMSSTFSGVGQSEPLLETIQGLETWNVGNVIDMSVMFNGCYNLKHIDLSTWKMSSCVYMGVMFQACYVLESIGDISGWEVGNVQYIDLLFYLCGNLNNIGDISNWDTSSVFLMRLMFRSCNSLTSLNNKTLNWNTTACIDMREMFNQCSVMNNVNLNNFDTSNVTDIKAMFSGNFALDTVNLDTWDISNVADTQYIFNNCPLSVPIYDGILNNNTGWISRGVQSGLIFDAPLAKYTSGGDAETGRTNLINTHGWAITDAGPV